MSTLPAASCQPMSSAPIVFRPGECFTFSPQVSWWTAPHIIQVALASLFALVLLVLAAALAWDSLIRPSRGQVTVREWFRLPKPERKRRIAAFRAADDALQAYRPPGRAEDETYLRLNGEVNRLWPTVPWWRRT